MSGLRLHCADVMLVQRLHMLSEVVYSDGSRRGTESERTETRQTAGRDKQVGQRRLFKSRFDCSVMRARFRKSRQRDRKIDDKRERGSERF